MCPFRISSHLPNSSTRCLDFKNKGTEVPRIYFKKSHKTGGFQRGLFKPPYPAVASTKEPEEAQEVGLSEPGEPLPLGASENEWCGHGLFGSGFGPGRESTWPSTDLGEGLEDCSWINWSHWEKILFITCWLIQCLAQNLLSSRSQGQ